MAMATAPRRVTEAANPLTTDIDTATPAGIVRLLGCSDAQLFSGYGGHPTLFSPTQLSAMACVSEAIKDALLGGGSGGEGGGLPGLIVCSGSGTSGRLAYFVTKAANSALAALGRPPMFRYLIAGGDHALIKAKEGAEDDPELAMRDLTALIERHNPKRVVVIGITCSMSAAYVRSQLEHAMDTEHFLPVLLGFNPVAAAKPPPRHKSQSATEPLRDIVAELGRLRCPEDAGRGVIINPVVGPEPIAGSTRMKGGSATKMILEAIVSCAIASAFGVEAVPAAPVTLQRLPAQQRQLVSVLSEYERAVRMVYLHTEAIAEALRQGAEALRKGGRIVYVGDGSAAILGLVDASECPPTYGAAFSDVCGFVRGGWEAMGNAAGDLSERDAPAAEAGTGAGAGAGAGDAASAGSARRARRFYNIAVTDFVDEIAPTLSSNDCVVMLGLQRVHPEVVRVVESADLRTRGTALVQVVVRYGDACATPVEAHGASTVVAVDLDNGAVVDGMPVYAELALKLVLNAVSTGAHVLKGTVYQNRMINLMVTNQKLFHRAVHIVSTFSGVTQEDATTALVRAIHKVDDVGSELDDLDVPSHVTVASSQQQVVPLAILLARMPRGTPTSTAVARIAAEPVLRKLVEGGKGE